MKTAEEILKEWQNEKSAYLHEDDCIGAMKTYAQQVAEKVRRDCESNAYSALDDYQVTNKVVVHTCDAIMKTLITLY